MVAALQVLWERHPRAVSHQSFPLGLLIRARVSRGHPPLPLSHTPLLFLSLSIPLFLFPSHFLALSLSHTVSMALSISVHLFSIHFFASTTIRVSLFPSPCFPLSLSLSSSLLLSLPPSHGALLLQRSSPLSCDLSPGWSWRRSRGVLSQQLSAVPQTVS